MKKDANSCRYLEVEWSEERFTVTETETTRKELSPWLFGASSVREAIAGATYTSQTEALLRLLNGENVFLSGLAGTGKTYVIESR